MTGVRIRGEEIRRFILEHVDLHPADISKVVVQRFTISRQAVNKHLQKLVSERVLIESGHTRNRIYKLAPLVHWNKKYKITRELAEDLVWKNDIKSLLAPLPKNVLDICYYGFTEMFNNAIDHSGATTIFVEIRKTATRTGITLADNGTGIFKKIKTELNLLDEQHAMLELSKGKLTTDKKRHTGQGIFFTSRMFDSFYIFSGGLLFSHQPVKVEDWITKHNCPENGTMLWMEIHNHTKRTAKKIFDQYATAEIDGFDTTVIPVRLAQYDNDALISRSQAKRLLMRIEAFKTVSFDFSEIDTIGQAFADEIFRVFAEQHPEIKFLTVNANSEVKRMILQAELAKELAKIKK